MSAREPAILGLDLGTSEVKAGLVTPDGRLLALARAAYPMAVGPEHGWAEQDPADWWSAVVRAVREVGESVRAEVVAIGVDGHGPTLVPVDARGGCDAAGDHLARHALDRARPRSWPRPPA